MTRLEFRDLSFREVEVSGERFIKVDFIRNYYFFIPLSDLEPLGLVSVEEHALEFEASEKKVTNKFYPLIDKGFLELKHKVRDKETIYIHRNLGLPLIGANEFGLVDRGSNIIEVKPLTGCNLSCVFCSVNEGKNDKRDLIVEEEFLVDELKMLAAIKEHPVEVCINPQGEPLLYSKLVDLVKDIRKIPNVQHISMNTNGLTGNLKLIDDLAEAGLDRMNISIHAMDKVLASKLADGPYNLDMLLKVIDAANGKIDVLLAPVIIPGQNEQELDAIIELSKKIKNKKSPVIGVQNYLTYKGGRNMGEQMPWDDFYALLRDKEQKHGVRLVLDESAFQILPDKTLPKPFRKGQVIEVEIVCRGRGKNEVLAAAGGRCVTVHNCRESSGRLRVRLLRDKHNIYTAVPA